MVHITVNVLTFIKNSTVYFKKMYREQLIFFLTKCTSIPRQSFNNFKRTYFIFPSIYLYCQVLCTALHISFLFELYKSRSLIIYIKTMSIVMIVCFFNFVFCPPRFVTVMSRPRAPPTLRATAPRVLSGQSLQQCYYVGSLSSACFN